MRVFRLKGGVRWVHKYLDVTGCSHPKTWVELAKQIFSNVCAVLLRYAFYATGSPGTNHPRQMAPWNLLDALLTTFRCLRSVFYAKTASLEGGASAASPPLSGAERR